MAVVAGATLRAAKGGRAFSRGLMAACRAGPALAAALATLRPGAARADLLDGTIAPETVLNLALVALTVGAAMITALWMIRQQGRTAAENDRLRAELADARNEADLRAALLSAEGGRLVVYAGTGTEPVEVLGNLPRALALPSAPDRFLAFNEWMPAGEAARVEAAVERLRARAEPFRREIEVAPGAAIEVEGRTVGALAVLRFAPLAGVRAELALLKAERERATATIETLQALFDAAPMPVWLRGADRGLVWVNEAYARAVEAGSVDEAVNGQVEFLAEQDRREVAARTARSGVFNDTVTAVVDADRRIFSVVDASGPLGSAGLAVDVSTAEAVRAELRETIRAHSETLDHLTTAVARFDARTVLTYHNAAFAKLFGFSAADLERAPDHVSMLDQLRSRGILPEDRPLRDLKNEILAAYRATEPTDALWHLADGRTLRVFASPDPRGGATWVFEDLTEKLQLESRLNTLVRLQGETLDFLNEAVAVFGQDGRLRLSNPSFAGVWDLSPEFLAAKPHIGAFPAAAGVGVRSEAGSVGWPSFCRAVTAFDEGARAPSSGEIELANGRVQAYGVVPLPNGQTMLTFTDVSDAREAERMLIQRNEALEHADKLKSDFVQHVNYELRSPLTTIIGFSALLRAPDTGSLNERQSEYLDYISTSTASLMTIVNDILDLATVDAGIMHLDLGEVDIARTAEQAADAVRDRLREHGVRLEVDVSRAGASFRADAHRVTQILFNLLSNAANFAPAGSIVRLSAAREGEELLFRVADEGPGIRPDQVARVFGRFEADPAGGRQSGAGLGLSIVKSFVELHEGRVEIASGPGRGTTVTCRFPLTRDKMDEAAE